jgi:hypothetical protein
MVPQGLRNHDSRPGRTQIKTVQDVVVHVSKLRVSVRHPALYVSVDGATTKLRLSVLEAAANLPTDASVGPLGSLHVGELQGAGVDLGVFGATPGVAAAFTDC